MSSKYVSDFIKKDYSVRFSIFRNLLLQDDDHWTKTPRNDQDNIRNNWEEKTKLYV